MATEAEEAQSAVYLGDSISRLEFWLDIYERQYRDALDNAVRIKKQMNLIRRELESRDRHGEQ